MTATRIQLTEASRDALQGLPEFVPTEAKGRYLRKLLAVGFSRLDCVSFVSPRAIPQMADSTEVLASLHKNELGNNRLLAIVAHVKGAEKACKEPLIDTLGYPLSLSETFQQRNTRRSITQAFKDLVSIQRNAEASHKQLRVYLSMGFGNPYGDPYNESILLHTLERLQTMGVEEISMADTLGAASPQLIARMLGLLLRHHPVEKVVVHLHARPENARDKLEAAYQAGCQAFDTALYGYGGCPMAADTLVGNLSTQLTIELLRKHGETLPLKTKALQAAEKEAQQLFEQYSKSKTPTNKHHT